MTFLAAIGTQRWQSTLFAGRSAWSRSRSGRNGAAVRHALWPVDTLFIDRLEHPVEN
jgi:hypothetical protein